MHFFVNSAYGEEMIFDPMDTDDYASIEQGVSHGVFQVQQNAPCNTQSCNFLNEQRSGKKDKEARYLSFDFVFDLPENTCMTSAHNSSTYMPEIPKRYNYLFYKEINPPPPKGC